jgi:hypothetical protein
MNYLTVKCLGYLTYCDALIARQTGSELQAFLFSLIGTPSHIQATSAVLFGGESCRVNQNEDPALNLKFSTGNIRTYRNRKIGNTVNKVMITTGYFLEKNQSATVVFGSDLSVVQDRAFLSFDAATGIPLKPEWQSWLWDEILDPEKLYSFGGEDLQEAYLIKWPSDAKLEEQILEGIKLNYLE